MKAFLALAFLATLGLLAEAGLEHLIPRDIVMPVNPKYTAQEWSEIMAAQVTSPEDTTNLKKGTKPQPVFAGKVHVPLDDNHHIIGCTTASRGQFPWQAALIINGASFCGGSLISELWVLTAAHCVGSTYEVILGATGFVVIESGVVVVTSRTSIVHEEYDANTLNNDIALILLPSVVTLSTYIRPVRLRSISGDLVGETVRFSGWDRCSRVATTLSYIDLIVTTNTVCAQTYGNIITSTKICTATTTDKCTCICEEKVTASI